MFENDVADTLEPIVVAGDTQWLLTRKSAAATAARRPRLLWVHGGPGSTLMPFSYRFDAPLLAHFDVFHWDQRASGKSFRPSGSHDHLDIAMFGKDLERVADHVRGPQGEHSLVVVGHSWGSVLTLGLAARCPLAAAHFICVGQVVDDARAQSEGVAFCRIVATVRGDAQTLALLSELESALPLSDARRFALSRALGECGGIFGDFDTHILSEAFAASPHVFADEEEHQEESVAMLVRALWPDILAFDASAVLARVEAPLHFIQGERDMATPTSLVEELVETHAEKRNVTYTRLPGLAHFPFWEDPQAFADAVVRLTR